MSSIKRPSAGGWTLLALAALLATLAMPAAADKLPVRYVVPGSLLPSQVDVEKAINDKLAKDGVNVSFHMIAIPWDAWQQKTNLMLATGEEFEMFEIMEDVIPMESYAGRNAIIPLDDLLAKYGSTLKKNVPDYMWQAARFKGKISAIPAPWLELSSVLEWICIRPDLYKKHNLAIPTTPAELLNACKVIAAGEPDLRPKAWAKIRIDSAEFLHRSYDTWPFTVSQGLFYVDQKGNVKSWLETDEYRKDAAFWHELYVNGLTDPNILSTPDDMHTNALNQGAFLFEHSMALFNWNALHKNVPDAEMQLILLNPDKPKFNNVGARNLNGVSSTSKHPEAAIQFMNWLYASQANHDLLIYGIEGSHWNKKAGQKMTYKNLQSDVIEAAMDPKTGNAVYSGPTWMIGNSKYWRWTLTDHPQWLEIYQPPKNAISGIALSFAFDTTPVSTEYANLQAELVSSFWPIQYGVADYNTAFKGALARMKAAGLDKVVEEYRKQFNAFLKSR